jgi:hypothetical protein
VLAKRISQLPADRSRNFTDNEYARIGYRASVDVMLTAARTGKYDPGLGLFRDMFVTADYWICQAGFYACTHA